ncbi:NAD+ synthase [Afifella sp. YEN Y35]|uniref:NAD+ synthase n=1 Tax=Afifella sp. YEN Y35 TaxID=3388337 RepID=UPI0039E11186
MTTDTLRIALAQLNPIVGDVSGNLKKALKAHGEAAKAGADLIVYSELFLSGYPPEDLVLRRAFQDACLEALDELVAATADGAPGILIGLPYRDNGNLHNSVALADGGELIGLRHKVDLPNYAVFDEKRVFDAGPLPGPIGFRGVRLGIPICEDIWTDEVTECLAETGAELLIVPNGSPYERIKPDVRMQVALERVVETGLPMIYLNQVGGQDELVFDGGSFGFELDRRLAFQMPQFEESVALTLWERSDAGWTCREGPMARLSDQMTADWRASVLGLKDYVSKNRFPGVVLGLSGGIDSAICAAIAVDALGPERVHCVMMPYRYTSSESLKDAKECAEALGVRYDIVPIAEAVEGFDRMLEELFAGHPSDVTEENIQSRVRGTLLMAISNKFGSMVVTTGNKSEMSVGYATLYGDMNGGFNPIKDLYKTEVYRLSRWRNDNRPEGLLGPEGVVIPENIIDKAPTAELREGQKDQDSLPPYEILDGILQGLVEREESAAELIEKGYEADTVKRVQKLLYIAEYKRRQAAPGVKISSKNFGRDRRYPIVNGWRDAV